MNKKQRKKYFYWREVQRNQLGTSANLFFIFTSATLGFIVSNTISENKLEQDFWTYLSLISLVLSIILYALFTYNRLHDYRKTARLIKVGLSEKKVATETKCEGKLTWWLFNFQIIFLCIGFVSILIRLI